MILTILTCAPRKSSIWWLKKFWSRFWEFVLLCQYWSKPNKVKLKWLLYSFTFYPLIWSWCVCSKNYVTVSMILHIFSFEQKVLLSSVFHCTSDLRIADSVIFLANLLRREDNVKHFNAKIWQSQNDVMEEKVIGRKATCCFSCIVAMVTTFVWIIVILHL